MTTPNIADWYWIKSDGAIFSSARNKIVLTYDGGYLAFVAQNGPASPWPADVNGQQSSAALQAIMSFYFPSYVVNIG